MQVVEIADVSNINPASDAGRSFAKLYRELQRAEQEAPWEKCREDRVECVQWEAGSRHGPPRAMRLGE